MDIKDLMSGIAVVIDDVFVGGNGDENDQIFEIVKKVESEWEILCHKIGGIPPANVCQNLLQSASFIMLDWKLWPGGASELESEGIQSNVNFLNMAKDFFIPVFIFTNESQSDVEVHLNEPLYKKEQPERNFIFVGKKDQLIKEGDLNVAPIESWIKSNASVHVLKTWEQAFHKSKRTLFSSMYEKSPDWPKVFWKSYKAEGINSTSPITHLINNNLMGRVDTDIFDDEVLSSDSPSISGDEIRSLMNEASFIKHREGVPVKEIKPGYLFKIPGGKYLINIRPDCDCVPRNGQLIDDVELYCIQGSKMRKSELEDAYENGHIVERIFQSVSFCIDDKHTVIFDFRKFEIRKFSDVKDRYIGCLIHPYITRIQQRYASYLQRQGLPSIPPEAISE